MRNLLVATLMLLSLASWSVCADAPAANTQPVWTIDFVKVKPGMFETAIRYFDAGWRPARDEAVKQGAIAGFHLVTSEQAAGQAWDIMLITEYRDQASYEAREAFFGPLLKKMLPNGPPVIDGIAKKDMYEIVESRVVHEARSSVVR